MADGTIRLTVDIPKLSTIIAMLADLQEAAVATQAQIDQIAQAINTAVDNIRQDIADLKAANPALDTSALDASVARLQTLDVENPPAASTGG